MLIPNVPKQASVYNYHKHLSHQNKYHVQGYTTT